MYVYIMYMYMGFNVGGSKAARVAEARPGGGRRGVRPRHLI